MSCAVRWCSDAGDGRAGLAAQAAVGRGRAMTMMMDPVVPVVPAGRAAATTTTTIRADPVVPAAD